MINYNYLYNLHIQYIYINNDNYIIIIIVIINRITNKELNVVICIGKEETFVYIYLKQNPVGYNVIAQN